MTDLHLLTVGGSLRERNLTVGRSLRERNLTVVRSLRERNCVSRSETTTIRTF